MDCFRVGCLFEKYFSFEDSFKNELILELPCGWPLVDGRPIASKNKFPCKAPVETRATVPPAWRTKATNNKKIAP